MNVAVLKGSAHPASLSLDDIKLIAELQPRAEIDRLLLDDYTAAVIDGAVMPPVVVFFDGVDYMLADGYHRWHAHRSLGLTDIAVDVRQGGFPDALRFSLAANAAHGKRRQPDDYRRAYILAVSNKLVSASDADAVADLLKCSVRWARELTQEARAEEQRKRDERINDLAAEGKSERQISAETGLPKTTVHRALEGGPERNSAGVDQPRTAELWQAEQDRQASRAQPQPIQNWTESEAERKAQVEAGECVVANLRGDAALLAWAESNGSYVRIDRRTEWGNPFEMPDDGERSDVVAKFASYYWPHKDGLLGKVGTLRGKVLACWCHPEQCHGHIIAATANRLSEGETLPEILDSFSCEGCS